MPKLLAFDLLSSPFKAPAKAERNWAAIVQQIGPTLAVPVLEVLSRHLAHSAEPDMALNNLERWLNQTGAAARLPATLDHNGRGLEALLQLLALSQFFADTLIAYPDTLDWILQPPRRNPTTDELIGWLRIEVEAATDDTQMLRAFRRFRQIQILRVGINDVTRDRPLEEVTRELARIADASLQVALQVAIRTMTRKFGHPLASDGQPTRVAALAFGKLGGDELNYSSDIDLMFVYDQEGECPSRRGQTLSASEFYSRVVTELIRLLSLHTDRGWAYRVDLRLRPDGQRGPLARSLSSTLSYYDGRGRTWERQALIKLRPVAGDLELGREFTRAIEPFVYRKYFSFSEINEVKALKRRMEQRNQRSSEADLDVKTGRGGIRDIEYTVQFLQLLNGGDLSAVRQRNTLLALEALEIAGCLTPEETYRLADAYRFLRKTEHRLQLLFDWQTHRLPAGTEELRTLARRMGYSPKARGETPDDSSRLPVAGLPAQRRSPLDEIPTLPTLDTKDLLVDPLDLFLKDYHDKTTLNRAILDHLLHQTFSSDGEGRAAPESDLILDPDPDPQTVARVLAPFPFQDKAKAYTNLTRLAQEAVPFLSGRRCRHFLANIAPQLLAALAETADPDAALNNLERVTASLGAKAVLYELFTFNPPSLKLYVDICANSNYLCNILTNNPGMIDELLDSLVLDQPRSDDDLRLELAELCRGAFDLDPIFHSFQDKELLRIGVQDLLGKSTVRQTTAALSAVADAVLDGVVASCEIAVTQKHGPATCRYAIIGLGKLGGREINYHSDLDVILVYEADGDTAAGSHQQATTHHHYFTELAQRAIRAASNPGPMGRLYAVDMRLRPTGKSGSLVFPLAEFQRYFSGKAVQLWERQALTRARPIRGEPEFCRLVMQAIREAVRNADWKPECAREILSMRDKLAASAEPRSIKRGRGGLADVEFAVQMLILKATRQAPEVLQANVWDALDALQQAGELPEQDALALREGYTFLRTLEARLRITTDRPLTGISDDPAARLQLARRLGFDAAEDREALAHFNAQYERIRADLHSRFRNLVQRELTRCPDA